MSEQQSDDDAPAVPLANAWAMTTVLALLTFAVVGAFFTAYTQLTGRLEYAQATVSRQQHCIAVRRACHNQELTSRLCALRQRAGLDPRSFGPTIEGEFEGVSCANTQPAQTGLCDLMETVETPTCNSPGAGAAG